MLSSGSQHSGNTLILDRIPETRTYSTATLRDYKGMGLHPYVHEVYDTVVVLPRVELRLSPSTLQETGQCLCNDRCISDVCGSGQIMDNRGGPLSRNTRLHNLSVTFHLPLSACLYVNERVAVKSYDVTYQAIHVFSLPVISQIIEFSVAPGIQLSPLIVPIVGTTAMSVDPYHEVQSEIQSSLQTAEQLCASFLRIRSTAREGNEELEWVCNEVGAK
ncbi:hypothetical protein B0F90DRAFT_852965 [Multifurca ochricompacta]|uniref:Syntaxin 6/10/61 N-terminal domain-containing protein n=1 Tax=Multifurca ochricompacta TaxID=376703 RepID=A0AAD4LW81_9AGAM|nr:hypothetical protein B0F90DRAFT_852965 [Multifurca ochricompacta]